MNEIRIANVPVKTKESLETIAGNLGIPVTTYIKSKLSEIVSSAPDHLKSKKKDF